MNLNAQFYAQPSYHGGVNFPVYSGSRRQAGGSIFSTAKCLILPVMKSVGKQAATSALGFAGDVPSDVVSGRNLKESLKEQGKAHASQFAMEGMKRALGTLCNNVGAPPGKRMRHATKSHVGVLPGKQKAARRQHKGSKQFLRTTKVTYSRKKRSKRSTLF